MTVYTKQYFFRHNCNVAEVVETCGAEKNVKIFGSCGKIIFTFPIARFQAVEGCTLYNPLKLPETYLYKFLMLRITEQLVEIYSSRDSIYM